MPRPKRPLWECPRCGRRFANRNQSHGCTRLTVSDCLDGKSKQVVELYLAFEAAVRACGPVRVHPTKTRIGFIARMTFAGARVHKDWVEAGMMLAHRSWNPRFHKFLPSGTGGVHVLRLESVDQIDDELRAWLAEAYQIGQQEPRAVPRPPAAPVQTRIRPPRRKTRGRAGKVFYIHWNEEELQERIAPLRLVGHELLTHWNAAKVGKLGDFLPDVVVISLDRLPSHGRLYASWIWDAKKRQHIPIIFAGGQPDKVALAQQQFPNAIYCATEEVPEMVSRLMRG